MGLQTTDTSSVVSYCQTLTKMFAHHLNIGSCISRVRKIEIFYKCLEGPRVRYCKAKYCKTGNQQNDEIRDFRDDRYVSASKALWGLYEIEIFNRSPTVVRLCMRLEYHDTPYFGKGQEEPAKRWDRAVQILEHCSRRTRKLQTLAIGDRRPSTLLNVEYRYKSLEPDSINVC